MRRIRYCAYQTFVLLLIAATLCSITGCKADPIAPGTKRLPPAGSLVVFIGPSEFLPEWPGVVGGARRLARELPYLRFEYQAPDTSEVAAYDALIAAALARSPVALCLYVTDPDLVAPSLPRIRRAQILLVTGGYRVPEAPAFAHVSVDWPGAAETLAENLKKAVAPQRSYLLVHDQGRDETATSCFERFLAVARSEYGVKCLESRNSAERGRAPQAQILEMVERYPHAGLVVTLDPEPWLSLRAPLRLRGKPRYATLSAVPVLWADLQNGAAAALVGPLDGDIGYAMVDFVRFGLVNEGGEGSEKRIRCELVTPQSLADFAARYAAAADADVRDLLPRARE